MRILCLGSAGFLGRHFAQHHIGLGDSVIAVDDMSSPYASWPFRQGDLEQMDAAEFLSEPIMGFDVVYQFAAPVGGREKIENDPLFNADSLRLDAALFRWAVQSRPGLVVYPSSSAVYGVGLQKDRTSRPLRERDLLLGRGRDIPQPDEMYGFTKLAGEMLALKAAQYGVNTLCIRPFSGYGEDQSPEYPMPSICARAARHEDPLIVWGSGEQRRDFIHVDDIVGATVAHLGPVNGYQTLNIGSGIATSFNQVARMAAIAAGYVPTLKNLIDMPAGVEWRFCDPSLMNKRYRPKVSLEEGIQRMVEAM